MCYGMHSAVGSCYSSWYVSCLLYVLNTCCCSPIAARLGRSHTAHAGGPNTCQRPCVSCVLHFVLLPALADGTSGGSLFGSYTAPQPGSLFAPAPAFGAARQSKDGEDNELGVEAEGAEGDAVFGGPEIAPVVQLSEVPKQTGEEEEDGLFAGMWTGKQRLGLYC